MLIAAIIVITIVFWIGVQTFLGFGVPLLTGATLFSGGVISLLYFMVAAVAFAAAAFLGAMVI